MHRPLLRVGFALIALLTEASLASAADDAWALLRKPGHVVLLRHSNAPGNATESNDMDFKDCSIQRNLDASGRAQAARIGDEFRKHGIKNVRLITSQYCRAADTAKLTRLGAITQNPALNIVFAADAASAQKARDLVKRLSRGPLTVLVTHTGFIQAVAGTSVESGEMVVVHLDQAGAIVADGRIAVP
jgi:phosphohistidine phosphatase SixA